MTILLSLLIGPHALAFAPSEDIHIGMEPTRVLKFTPDVQMRMRHAPAWQDFLSGEGADWLASYDEQAGTVHRAWGAGIDLGPLTDEASLEAAVLSFFERNPGLLGGVQIGELVLKSAGRVERSETWTAQFDRVIDGVPVYRGGVKVIFRYGKLIMFDIATHPGAASVDRDPSVSSQRALDVLIADGPEPDLTHDFRGAELVLLPYVRQGLEYRLTWEVRTVTKGDYPGHWVGHVDAHTGELLNVYNDVKFLTGTVYGTHDDRAPSGATMTSPIPFVQVEGDTTDYTDVSGNFSVDGSAADTTFQGEYFRVYNSSGGDASERFSDSTFTWTDANATMAEIGSFVWLSEVRDWALTYAPDVRQITDDAIRSNVNVRSGSCNAYWDGSVNFYEAQGSCNNTGRIADVNYHEWGHGFHYYSLLSGSFDSSMSEGISDVVSHLHTDDPVMAPYFYTSGSGIRTADNTMSYPDDYRSSDVHSNGTIFSGAMWDLWDELERELGSREDAQVLVSQLLADAVKFGPDVAGSYDAVVAADDDDGDLGNGTPHLCAILEAFGKHGLGPGSGAGLVQLQHAPIWQLPAFSGNHTVNAEIVNMAADCNEISADNARVFFSTNGGATWESTLLEVLSDDSVEGAIPEQTDGSIVHYYFELTDSDGDVFTAPSGGAINPFSFFVGELVELYCEDFEDGEGGFGHELIDGEYSTGADDWQYGVPNGKTSDPNAAWSGDHVWGNDLGYDNYKGSSWNGEYQAEKHNQLYSPSVDISESGGGGLVLQFARYLGVEDGLYDQALITVDGEEVWANHASSGGEEHHLDEQWGPHTQYIEDFDSDGSVDITWDIISDQGLQYGGWNVDDICVYAWMPGEDTDPGTDDGGTTDSGGDDTGVDTTPGDDGAGPGDGGGSDDGGVDGDPLEDGTINISGKGCACSSTEAPAPGPLAGLFGLMALAMVRRRR